MARSAEEASKNARQNTAGTARTGLESDARVLSPKICQEIRQFIISLKSVLEGDTLVIKYMTIVYFAAEHDQRIQVQRANEQALQLIDARIAELKSDYREKAGETLTVEDQGGRDNIELVSMAPTTPRKVAYYRYSRTYKIE